MDNPVMSLNDAEIADFLWRHPVVYLQVISGTLTQQGAMVEDAPLNGWVLVYVAPGEWEPRYLWMHDKPADYQTFIQAVTGAVGAGATAGFDSIKNLVILGALGIGAYVIYNEARRR